MHLGCRVGRRGRGASVQMSLSGTGHAGLTIYCDGRRIPVDYEVLDDKQRKLSSGKMQYG